VILTFWLGCFRCFSAREHCPGAILPNPPLSRFAGLVSFIPFPLPVFTSLSVGVVELSWPSLSHSAHITSTPSFLPGLIIVFFYIYPSLFSSFLAPPLLPLPKPPTSRSPQPLMTPFETVF